MVGAGHVAYTDRFHELARLVSHLVTPESKKIERSVYGLAPQIRRMVVATEPKTIHKAVQIFGALTDEVVRNGSIKKVEKRGNVGEPSKDKNGRDENKRTRTGNAFAYTANLVERENTGAWPKTGGNHPNQVTANNEGQGRGNQGNQARGRAFILGAEEASQDLYIVTVGDIDNSTTNVLIPLDSWTSGILVYKLPLSEFEKFKDVKVEDVSLTCDTPLEIFNMEVSQLSGMDNDLSTYEVEVANIPCNSKKDDDDDDMGGDDEVKLTDEESSDNEDVIAEVFRIDTNIFDYETPLCSAFNEFNYLLKVDPDLLTKDIMGLRPMKITKMTGSTNGIKIWRDDGYYNGGNLPGTYIVENQLHYQDYERYKALEYCELKYEALRNKAITEGFIKEDDDESRYEQKIRWNIYTNYDDAYESNHDDNEREELCEVRKVPVCNIRKYMMIKYLFNNNEEYVAVKEDEYDDLTITRKEACRAYQEIFWIMDEGWIVTRAE
ncbi:hypothetical protein Tco_0396817 [Tanacetum coccineum]